MKLALRPHNQLIDKLMIKLALRPQNQKLPDRIIRQSLAEVGNR